MNTPFKKRDNPLSLNQKTSTTAEPVEDRVKYTATMEKQLRFNLKVAAAKKNIQISQYIEEAVREKLEREGF